MYRPPVKAPVSPPSGTTQTCLSDMERARPEFETQFTKAFTRVLLTRWLAPRRTNLSAFEAFRDLSITERFAHFEAACLPNKSSVYHCGKTANVSVDKFVARVIKYMHCSVECFVIAVILLDRFTSKRCIPVDTSTAYRLLITAVAVSAKNHDDVYHSNKYYAQVAGISTVEFNTLEIDFLFGLRWELEVSREDYVEIEAVLLQEMSLSSQQQQQPQMNEFASAATRGGLLHVPQRHHHHHHDPTASLSTRQYVHQHGMHHSPSTSSMSSSVGHFDDVSVSTHHSPWASRRSSNNTSPQAASTTAPASHYHRQQQQPRSPQHQGGHAAPRHSYTSPGSYNYNANSAARRFTIADL